MKFLCKLNAYLLFNYHIELCIIFGASDMKFACMKGMEVTTIDDLGTLIELSIFL